MLRGGGLSASIGQVKLLFVTLETRARGVTSTRSPSFDLFTRRLLSVGPSVVARIWALERLVCGRGCPQPRLLDGVRLVLRLRALPATHRIFHRAIWLLALIIRS